MARSTWSISQWVLLILAAVVVGSYFGVLGPVGDALEPQLKAIEKHIPQATLRSQLERLGNQPKVRARFTESETARAEAAVILGLFVFLTPIAAGMAIVVLVFVLTAVAHTLPLPETIPIKLRMLALLFVLAIATYAVREHWAPTAEYYAGLVAKTYLVATSGK